jgi:hypothetical protein
VKPARLVKVAPAKSACPLKVAPLKWADSSDLKRREFHEVLPVADSFEGLPGKWEAAILKAEQNAPSLRIVGGG